MKYFLAQRYFYNRLDPKSSYTDQIVIIAPSRKKANMEAGKGVSGHYTINEISKEAFEFERDVAECKIIKVK